MKSYDSLLEKILKEFKLCFSDNVVLMLSEILVLSPKNRFQSRDNGAKIFTSVFDEEQLDALEKELESERFVPLCRQHNKKGIFREFNSLETIIVGMILAEMD